jgi:hypothetical protein
MVKAALGDPTQGGGTSDRKTSAVRGVRKANQWLAEAVDD